MQNTSSSSSNKLFRPASRRAACTHIKASRQYDENALCSHCGRPGDQGWVYRCTQDSDGRLPIKESGLDEDAQQEMIKRANDEGCVVPGMVPSYSERAFKAEEDVEGIATLKPWMIKAIAEGQYTPEQVAKLVAQRMQVKAAIEADEKRIALKEQKRMLSDAKQRLTGKITPAPDNRSLGIDGQQERVSKKPANTDTTEETLDSRLEARRQASLCEYRCCPSCRPAMRDRAWPAIDSAISPEDPKAFAQDFDTRPLAEANIVLGIKAPRKALSSVRSSGSINSQGTEEVYIQELCDQIARHRSPSFIENARHLFRNYFNESANRDQDLNDSDTVGSSSSYRSQNTNVTGTGIEDRMAALDVARPESRIGESRLIDVISNGDLSQLTPELFNLMQHPSIANMLGLPLGTHQRGELVTQTDDGNPAGEVQVRNGVAVTEEAVGLGLADIITQI